MIRNLSLLYFLLSILVCLASSADPPIVLFNEGKSAPDYDHLVEELKPESVVQFSDGSRWRIKKYLGGQVTTRIFSAEPVNPQKKIPNPVALRIPRVSRFGGYLDETLSQYEMLENSEVRIPERYQWEPGEYLAVEQVGADVNLDDYLDNLSFGPTFDDPVLDTKERWEAWKALHDFVKSTADFAEIGDFRLDQVSYDRTQKEWILLDWAGGNRAHRKGWILPRYRTIFSGVKLPFAFDSETKWKRTTLRGLKKVIQEFRLHEGEISACHFHLWVLLHPARPSRFYPVSPPESNGHR